jgi:hypothetical protein
MRAAMREALMISFNFAGLWAPGAVFSCPELYSGVPKRTERTN